MLVGLEGPSPLQVAPFSAQMVPDCIFQKLVKHVLESEQAGRVSPRFLSQVPAGVPALTTLKLFPPEVAFGRCFIAAAE